MPLLRFAYVLALALWLGGMIVLGAVVAPSLFSTLGTLDPDSGRALAGAAFGSVLRRFHYLAYAAGLILLVTLTAMALLGPRPRSFAIRMAIVAVMLGVAAYSGIVVLGEIDGIQRQVVALASAPHTTATPAALPASSDTPRQPGSGLRSRSRRLDLPLPSDLPTGNPLRVRFDQLHVLSTRLMMFNIAAALVMLVWEALEPSR